MDEEQPWRAWSVPALAEHLGVSRVTVWRWYKTGRIKGVRFTPTGNIKIPEEDVDRLLEQLESLTKGESDEV